MTLRILVGWMFLPALAASQTLLNPSFETWGDSALCEVNTTADGWLNYSNGGIGSDEANFNLCPTTIPPAASNGIVYSRSVAFGGSGEGQYQIVSGFLAGASYSISFDYAGSNLYGGLDSVRWHIFIDDIDVDQTPAFKSTDTIWSSHSYTFIATATSHKIGVRAFAVLSSGTGSAAIDNFGLNSSAVVALFTAPNAICPGTCTQFLNGSFNATNFQWYFPGAVPSSSTDVNPANICYNNPGNYDVTLIADNGIQTDTLALANYITVYSQPLPQSITQSGDTLYANQGAMSYQWFYNGNLLNGATNYWVVAQANGNYNVIATDTNGCEVEAVIFDVVTNLPISVSAEWKIFPNPVISGLEIQSPISESQKSVSVIGMTGQKIHIAPESEKTSAGFRTIRYDLSSFPNGIYLLEIISDVKNNHYVFIKQ
jgi:hypothetical protein